MANSRTLPAIRSRMGDWTYYVTTLTFEDVSELVQRPDEIHNSRRLSEWIQRELVRGHAEAIADYLKREKQRFFGSLIVGVYDGEPRWSPLEVDFRRDVLDVPESEQQDLLGRLGLLKLSGEEKLFAIDGQHRVEGIKRALRGSKGDDDLEDDQVCAIFVAHDASSEAGRARTRRLFTTVNKTAKRVSLAARIALDEDDGLAVATRRLIDEFWLFSDDQNRVSYSSTGSLPSGETSYITSIVGLYQIVEDLYPPKGRKDFCNRRPSEGAINRHVSLCSEYWNSLLQDVEEYRAVLVERTGNPADFREPPASNHLLFRPIGQRAFARATELLLSRKYDLGTAISVLQKAPLLIGDEAWHHILWNPVDKKMITNKIVLAETQLLDLAGQPARTKKNKERLQELLEARSQNFS